MLTSRNVSHVHVKFLYCWPLEKKIQRTLLHNKESLNYTLSISSLKICMKMNKFQNLVCLISHVKLFQKKDLFQSCFFTHFNRKINNTIISLTLQRKSFRFDPKTSIYSPYLNIVKKNVRPPKCVLFTQPLLRDKQRTFPTKFSLAGYSRKTRRGPAVWKFSCLHLRNSIWLRF